MYLKFKVALRVFLAYQIINLVYMVNEYLRQVTKLVDHGQSKANINNTWTQSITMLV